MSTEVINGLFSIVGAVLGALITALVAIIIHRKSRQRKELTIYLSKPKRLVSVDDVIKDSIEIKVAGRKAETASHMDYYIANTGNSVIDDVNIGVKTIGNTDIIGGNVPEKNFDSSDELDLVVGWENEGGISIKAGYLNPGEKVSGYILLANIPDDVEVKYRAPGVKLVLKKNYDASSEDLFYNLIIQMVKSNPLLDIYFRAFSRTYREKRNNDEL
ncbi:hypothetical protein [Halovibrio salipaludis]|uniref:hypothetical protein n=1 Tax=Halovibrio salipaludis TaxID=2032626 RepID=UPI00117B5F7B|nr:hypothetical protein [Halovibrio salipaludis]